MLPHFEINKLHDLEKHESVEALNNNFDQRDGISTYTWILTTLVICLTKIMNGTM